MTSVNLRVPASRSLNQVEHRLMEAAASYVQKDGETRARQTIQSGLKAGQAQPRDLSHVNRDRNGIFMPRARWHSNRPAPLAAATVHRAASALRSRSMSSPPALQTYCRELAEATLAPLDFVGLSMLVTAGAAIGQSVNIRVKRGWNEAPLLFGILVAPPGKTKSPVIRAVVKPLAEIDRRLREESGWPWSNGKSPRRPTTKIRITTHPRPGTAATACDRQGHHARVVSHHPERQPRGVSVRSGRGFRVGCLVQRVQGKGRFRSPVLAFHLGLCSVSVDRKGGRESTYVPFPFVSVLGGLPPTCSPACR